MKITMGLQHLIMLLCGILGAIHKSNFIVCKLQQYDKQLEMNCILQRPWRHCWLCSRLIIMAVSLGRKYDAMMDSYLEDSYQSYLKRHGEREKAAAEKRKRLGMDTEISGSEDEEAGAAVVNRSQDPAAVEAVSLCSYCRL